VHTVDPLEQWLAPPWQGLAGGPTLPCMKSRVDSTPAPVSSPSDAVVGLFTAAVLLGVVTVPIVHELVVDEGSNAWRLGYNDAVAGKQYPNPLEGVPEESWSAVSERLAEECEEHYEASADPRGPDWEDFCAGNLVGHADRLRGTHVLLEASWEGWDYD